MTRISKLLGSMNEALSDKLGKELGKVLGTELDNLGSEKEMRFIDALGDDNGDNWSIEIFISDVKGMYDLNVKGLTASEEKKVADKLKKLLK